MSARTGMTELIKTLRAMTHTSTNDYTLGTVIYWSDDHLQTILDAHRQEVIYDRLQYVDEYDAGGTLSVKRYYSSFGNYEQTTGGTSIFQIVDATHVNVGTANYTPNYERGEITFSANTGGSTYYLLGRSYDLNRAAADVWRQKAVAVSEKVDFSTDNHNIRRSQLIQNCMLMVQVYEAKAGPRNVQVDRSDT